MALPIRTRPRFPHSQSLTSGSFHKPLILIHQRADRMKTTITENESNWSGEPQPCLTQWNYELCHVGLLKMDWSWGRALTWSTGEGNDKPLQYSCLENPTNSMKRQKVLLKYKKILIRVVLMLWCFFKNGLFLKCILLEMLIRNFKIFVELMDQYSNF